AGSAVTLIVDALLQRSLPLARRHIENAQPQVLGNKMGGFMAFNRHASMLKSAKIGEGGFGCVYIGSIKSPQELTKKINVSVKQLGRRGLLARFLHQLLPSVDKSMEKSKRKASLNESPVDDSEAAEAANKMLFSHIVEGLAGTLRPYWFEATMGRASAVQAYPDMIEIMPVGSMKGSGMRMLLDHFGIAPNEVTAIGDGENDIEMIELASLGIALSNGSEN
ncbi:endoribonuclease YBEY, chloroplastic, partial [Tanacetum coccineum]